MTRRVKLGFLTTGSSTSRIPPDADTLVVEMPAAICISSTQRPARPEQGVRPDLRRGAIVRATGSAA